MISDIFQLYQKEVEDGLTLVKTQKIPAGDWKAAEENLKQCAQTLTLMEQDARANRNASRKDTAMVTVNSLRKEIDGLLADVQRSSLLNRSRIGSDDDDDLEKGSLLHNDDEDRKVLTKSQSALEDSRRRLAEMTQVGTGIQEDLGRQSNTISGIRHKVGTTNSLASQGRNILRTIEKNDMRNKLCAYGAVAVVFVGVVIAIYWIMFRT